jgi:PmbA protein
MSTTEMNMSTTEMNMSATEVNTKMNMDFIAQLTAQIASELGIQKYDVFGAANSESSVQVQHGKPQMMKAAQKNSVVLRVWDAEGRSGVASSNDLSAEGLRQGLRMAQEASPLGTKEYDFSPESTTPLKSNSAVSNSKIPEKEQDLSTMLKDLLWCEKTVFESESRIKSLPYNGLAERSGVKFYYNSLGSKRFEQMHSVSCYLYSKTEEQNKKPRDAYVVQVKNHYSDLKFESLCTELVDKTRSHLDYTSTRNGSFLVVFSADAFLALLDAFSNMFNAQDVLDAQSLATRDSLGQKIGSALLSVSDDPLNSSCVTRSTFDGEGSPTQQTFVIERGVLTSFLHSSHTAKTFATKTTGNGVLGSKVRVGAHFWNVERGEKPALERDLWKEKEIVWVDELKSLHAGVNSIQGSFSLPFSGWIVENGKRVSIEFATVAGDFGTLLKNICFVEEQKEHTPEGVCPRVWVEGLSVTNDTEP